MVGSTLLLMGTPLTTICSAAPLPIVVGMAVDEAGAVCAALTSITAKLVSIPAHMSLRVRPIRCPYHLRKAAYHPMRTDTVRIQPFRCQKFFGSFF
jgi:hypothetical protein